MSTTSIRCIARDVRQSERCRRHPDRALGGRQRRGRRPRAELDVSAATIRRDLELLEEQRLLARTHGGAVRRACCTSCRCATRARGTRTRSGASPRRRRGASPTAWPSASPAAPPRTEVARALVDRERLTVVTNALNIASELAVRPNLKLVVTGGSAGRSPTSWSARSPSSRWPGCNLDLVFLGVDGIDARGRLTTHHEVEAHTNLALIERARRSWSSPTRSKIGRVAFARICPVDRVHELITDAGANVARPCARSATPAWSSTRYEPDAVLRDLPLRDFRPGRWCAGADASCRVGRRSRRRRAQPPRAVADRADLGGARRGRAARARWTRATSRRS